MKKWLATIMAAGCIFFGSFGVAHAADWYYIDADTDDSAWFIDNSSVLKEINRPDSTSTEVNATVYSQYGVALLSSNEKQKPVKIEKDTIGSEVMQALWGK